MDLALLVYGISLLHGIGSFFVATIIICGATTFILSMYRATECDRKSYYSTEENDARVAGGKNAVKWIKRLIVTGIISAWILILIPSEKTAYTMVGAYAAQKVVENDKVQAMSGKVLTIIEQKLDGYIEDGIKEAEDKLEKTKKKK